MSNVVKMHRVPVGIGLPKILVCPPRSEEAQSRDRQRKPGTTGTRAEETPSDAEFARGFEQGRREAEQRMRAEAERAVEKERERIQTFLASLESQLRSEREMIEKTAARFALAVAEKIVRREIQHDKEFVLGQVREALKRVVGVARVQLRVHPSDEPVVRSHRAGVAEGVDSLREFSIEVDDTIEPGGCIIESDSGNVDARLATQLKQIEEALLGRNVS